MTGVPDTPAFNASAADGVSTIFNFSFFVFEDGDIKVFSVLNDVETPITTGITKIITPGNVGGTVTFDVAPLSAVGDILIRREVDYDQTTEFSDITRFKETSIETALNNLCLQIQQIRDAANLGIQYSEVANITDAVIETPVDGTLLGFNGTAGRISSVTLASITTDLDTLFTALTAEDFIKFDGVKWINRTPAEVIADIGALAAANNLSDLANAVTAFNNIKQAATESATGVVEAATTAEMNAGTADKFPDAAKVKAYADTKTPGWTYLASQATTSGSVFDFSIPAAAKEVDVFFIGNSLTGTNIIGSQLGDAGGIETSGYTTTGLHTGSTTLSAATSADGFKLGNSGAAARVIDGGVRYSLVDAAAFLWEARGAISGSVSQEAIFTMGMKALSAALTTIRVTRFGGADTFDAGTLYCRWR